MGGEVLECIKAQANGLKGKFISSAVMTTTVIVPNGKFMGGFAGEYSGNDDRKGAEVSLEESITGIIERINFGKIEGRAKLYKNNKTDKGYTINSGKNFVYEGIKVKKHH
jgi:pyruvoyl-dependent arginine decarboxylase (PvlArgDC)